MPILEEMYFINYDNKNYNYDGYEYLVGNLLT
jgi:hypothetical protein